MVNVRRPAMVGLSLLLWACGEPADVGLDDADDVADVGSVVGQLSPAAISLEQTPRASVEIARALLASASQTDMTPAWTETATLDDAVFVYERPDVTGPAYYEFTVRNGGRILVSTGEHDTPIPTFSDRGEATALKLLDQAEAHGAVPTRLVRLNAQDMVALDDEGTIVSELDDRGKNLGLLLEDYLDNYVAPDKQAAAKSTSPSEPSFAQEWAALYTQGDADALEEDELVLKGTSSSVLYEPRANLAVKDVKWLYHYDLLLNQIHWYQFDVSTNAKVVCYAGCGPVALAQLAAYLAYSDRWGNPKYVGSNVRVLYPNVSVRPTAPEAKALIRTLHTTVESLCWNEITDVSSLSAALPWNMSNFVEWAEKKGAKLNWEDAWENGDNEAAWNALRRGNPVVFGWRHEHYNVGVGAGTLNGSRYIWVNNGQSSVSMDGWFKLESSFYTGIVQSWVKGK